MTMAEKNTAVPPLSTLVTSCFPWAMHRQSNSDTDLEQVSSLSLQFEKAPCCPDLKKLRSRLMEDIPNLHNLSEGEAENHQEVLYALHLAGRCLNCVQRVRAEQESGNAVSADVVKEVKEKMSHYNQYLCTTGLRNSLQQGEGQIHVCDKCHGHFWRQKSDS